MRRILLWFCFLVTLRLAALGQVNTGELAI